MFLFYRYYTKGGTFRIPYFSALCATVFLIYIHVFQVFIVLDKVNFFPMRKDDLKIIKYGKLALFLLPIFILVSYLIKESDLKHLEYDEKQIKSGGTFLVLYVILSVVLLFALMFAFAKK